MVDLKLKFDSYAVFDPEAADSSNLLDLSILWDVEERRALHQTSEKPRCLGHDLDPSVCWSAWAAISESGNVRYVHSWKSHSDRDNRHL